jgi:hypothetical protein
MPRKRRAVRQVTRGQVSLIQLKFSVLAEINWQFEGDEEDPNWCFCNRRANFSHREACEFVLHIGDENVDSSGVPEYARSQAQEMFDAGCTRAFINAYLEAAASGAMRVLVWC